MNTAIQEQPKTELAPWMGAIASAEGRFLELAKMHSVDVNWRAEANYARQLIQNSNALASCRPDTIRDAVINIGAMGLSLAPTKNQVYLVPRGGVCTAAVSYIGFIDVAVSTGIVEHIRADVVYETDDFTYNGPSEKCTHRVTNPFNTEKRGAKVGVYAQAKLASGDWLTEIMDMKELDAVQKASKASSGPWKSFWSEMAKKSVLRRLFKTLPKSGKTEALTHTMKVIDETEGLDAKPEEHQPTYTPEQHKQFHDAINGNNAIQLLMLIGELDAQVQEDLYRSFEKGKKTSGKAKATELQKQARDEVEAVAQQLTECFGNDDVSGGGEIILDYTPEQAEFIFNHQSMTNEVAEWAREILK